jgi:hypothetical protein
MATCPSGHQSASDDYCDVCGALIGSPGITPDLGSTSASAASSSTASGRAGGSGSAEDTCPRCGVPRGAGHFCEGCGLDFDDPTAVSAAIAAPPAPPAPPGPSAPPPLNPTSPPTVPSMASVPSPPSAPSGGPTPASTTPPPSVAANGAAWTIVVTADRGYYDSVQDAGGPDAAGIGFPAYCPERRFRLSGAEVRVGRRSESRGIHPEIDLTGPPADPGVSRLHVVLLAGPDGGWSVVDLGSANGTLVNGTEIAPDDPVPLGDGDVIHLGAWTALTVTTG